MLPTMTWSAAKTKQTPQSAADRIGHEPAPVATSATLTRTPAGGTPATSDARQPTPTAAATVESMCHYDAVTKSIRARPAVQRFAVPGTALRPS